MPFLPQSEDGDDFPRIESDIAPDGSIANPQGGQDEHVATETDGDALNDAELISDSDDKESVDLAEDAPVGTMDEDIEDGSVSPGPPKKRSSTPDGASSTPQAGAASPPPSTKPAPATASTGRKRKAAESSTALEADPAPAKKRGRPSGPTAATTSARLAAKAADKPTRGRPKVTATATSGKPSRGQPKSTPTAAARAAKRATKEKSSRGHLKSDVNQVPEDEWEVEGIVDSGIDSETSEHKYLVKWKGYSSKDNTWEPKSNLAHCLDLVRKFDAQQKSKPRTKEASKAIGNDKQAAQVTKEPKKRGRKPKAKI